MRTIQQICATKKYVYALCNDATVFCLAPDYGHLAPWQELPSIPQPKTTGSAPEVRLEQPGLPAFIPPLPVLAEAPKDDF